MTQSAISREAVRASPAIVKAHQVMQELKHALNVTCEGSLLDSHVVSLAEVLELKWTEVQPCT